MKKLLFIASVFLTLVAGKIHATPQTPEILIIGRDTLSILELPLDGLDDETRERFMKNLRPDEGGDNGHRPIVMMSSLARGYRAIWEIADGNLYLTGLDRVENSGEILQKTFGESYSGGRVHAVWFSSRIIVPRGETLQWDGVYARTFYNEEFYHFDRGVVTKRERVENYIPVPGGISRRQDPFQRDPSAPLADAMIKAVKDRLPASCTGDYIVTIGPEGRVTKVEYAKPQGGRKMCLYRLKCKLKKLRFDIVKWNGKPYEENVSLQL